MKRILATILTLVILLSVAPSVGTVAEAAVTSKPFVALNWGKVEEGKYDNVAKAYVVEVKNIGGQLKLGGTEPDKLAKTVKTALDKLPDDMKYIRLFRTGTALELDAELVIYADAGIRQLRQQFEEFIKAYKDLGGKLAGVILDTEYTAMGSWYLYGSPYGGHYASKAPEGSNRNFYHDVVAHPKYKKELRPMLEEAGFTFYEEISGDRSEIWSMYPPQTIKQVFSATKQAEHNAKYGDCYSIWNRVMYNRIAMYFDYAIYEPLKELYPNANMSDYQSYDGDTWYENLYSGTNGVKTGNVSNSNDYSHLPNSSYFKDGSTYLYQNPASYNNAVYDDDPYGMLLWNINKFKNMYDATDTKKVSVWIAEYDYSSRSGSYNGNTAYYTESLYHYGMLDPQPFLIYLAESDGQWKDANKQFDSGKYYNRLDVISEILDELTAVAGYSDRKPISVPVNWNDGYLLSGSYANGRNVWRITPDITSGTTKEAFKIKDKDPTFKINGTTITFPGGKILKEGSVSTGSVGYWVETAKDVKPVVTRDADRYSENPSYVENYESYKTGTALTSSNVALPQTWTIVANKELKVTAQGNGKALALTGTAALTNVKLPKNITAGDSYASQQAWEVSVTLPKAMNDGATVMLLRSEPDGGIKLQDGKVYYDELGKYKELEGVTLETGKKYTFKRDVDFDKYACTYSVYADGKLLKQVANVDMETLAVPVEKISINCTNLTTQVLIDDYKLYPTGVVTDLSVYDYYGGEELLDYDKHAKAELVYRVSWMNATAQKKTVKIKAAFYDKNNALVSESVIDTLEMAPGDDGVIIGSVKSKSTKMKVYVDDGSGEKPPKQTETPAVEATPDEENNGQQTQSTKATKPTETKAKLTKPTRATQAKNTKATKATEATKGTDPTKATKATTETKPGETLAPDATDETLAPGETLAPDASVAPDETLLPDETQAPDGQEEPKDNAKGNMAAIIIGSAVGVLAVAGGVSVIMKKKFAKKAKAPETTEVVEEFNDDIDE